ncbi:MAG: HTH domain-containing protein [Pirellulales bacterium]|jgi:predicted DNA-binding transcriptional regulator YafY|nr:hypothetical protein [Rhodopirellula sp.]MCH2369096.1 HTH domain-containing protein [Pirellulales bacterium]MCH2600737.1 HTH domain-containing protein [Pirellulales bacterium]|tara:strand:- start:7004 stop:7747 length:744 start_codon:yes stop_codon:yes gene_type:complete
MPFAPQVPQRFAGRAYKIAEQIRTGTQVTAENLAERFNVSKRTIYRDLDLLRKSGISVQYDNLTDSYCIIEERIQPGKGEFQINRRCTLQHLRDLVLATRCSPWMNIEGIHSGIETIIEMFLDKLDLTQRQSIRKLYQACEYETHSPRNSTLERDLLRALADSVMNGETLEILIVDNLISRNSDIDIDNWEDYALWLRFDVHNIYVHEATWYFSGYCHDHQEHRSYALNNVMNAALASKQPARSALG